MTTPVLGDIEFRILQREGYPDNVRVEWRTFEKQCISWFRTKTAWSAWTRFNAPNASRLRSVTEARAYVAELRAIQARATAPYIVVEDGL